MRKENNEYSGRESGKRDSSFGKGRRRNYMGQQELLSTAVVCVLCQQMESMSMTAFYSPITWFCGLLTPSVKKESYRDIEEFSVQTCWSSFLRTEGRRKYGIKLIMTIRKQLHREYSVLNLQLIILWNWKSLSISLRLNLLM